MTKKKKISKTRCILILDRSWSMNECAQMAVQGYNEYVDDFWAQEKDGLDIDVCLVTFNGKVYEHLWGVKASSLKKASVESFDPSGNTALYDAIGYVIDKCTQEDDGETAYQLTIITDGDNNASKHYDLEMVGELLEGTEKSDRWTVGFLGSSKKNLLEMVSNSKGAIKQGSTAVWSNSANGADRMMRETKAANRKYFAARKRGETKVDCLYSNDNSMADYSDMQVAMGDQSLIDAANNAWANAQKGTVGGWTSGGSIASPLKEAFWKAPDHQTAMEGAKLSVTNVGTADVFSASAHNCVMDANYCRPSQAAIQISG